MKLPYQRNNNYFNKITALKQKITEARRVANINWLLLEVEMLYKTD